MARRLWIEHPKPPNFLSTKRKVERKIKSKFYFGTTQQFFLLRYFWAEMYLSIQIFMLFIGSVILSFTL